jgi:zinc transporter ZupT
MVGASIGLIVEGSGYDAARTAVGLGAGACLIAVTSRLLERRDDPRLGSLRGPDAVKALLVVGVMTLHSLAEGIGVGVAFGDGASLAPAGASSRACRSR